MADDKEVEKTIAEDLVVTKYKLAGQIVNRKFIPNYKMVLKQLNCLINGLVRRMCEWDGRVSSHRHAANVRTPAEFGFISMCNFIY